MLPGWEHPRDLLNVVLTLSDVARGCQDCPCEGGAGLRSGHQSPEQSREESKAQGVMGLDTPLLDKGGTVVPVLAFVCL